MKLEKDSREFIESLNSASVRYVIVGGYAVAFHGFPRFTGDIDFLIEVSPANAAKMQDVIVGFGFGGTGLAKQDFLKEDVVIQLGLPPNRIDIITSLTGVGFDEVWAGSVAAKLDGLPVRFIGKDALLKNKSASGRAQDRVDIEKLNDPDA